MAGRVQGFADRLRAEREKTGLTMYALAKRAGVTKQAVARLESGESQPTWETVQRIVKALGISCEALADPTIGVADDSPPARRGRPAKAPQPAQDATAPTGEAEAARTPKKRPQAKRGGKKGK